MVAVVIVATMFVLFLVFNIFSGYAADDYLYFFKYAGHTLKGTPQRLTGIGDIIAGMKVHYLQWADSGTFHVAAFCFERQDGF